MRKLAKMLTMRYDETTDFLFSALADVKQKVTTRRKQVYQQEKRAWKKKKTELEVSQRVFDEVNVRSLVALDRTREARVKRWVVGHTRQEQNGERGGIWRTVGLPAPPKRPKKDVAIGDLTCRMV